MALDSSYQYHGVYRVNGKEHGTFYSGLSWVLGGVLRDNGEENGNDYVAYHAANTHHIL